MSRAPLTTAEYREALREHGLPGGRQLKFLEAHARSKGRVSTTLDLRDAAKYENFNAINLVYGRFAERIGRLAGHRVPKDGFFLETLMSFEGLDELGHLRLRMYPEFARALEAEGWI